MYLHGMGVEKDIQKAFQYSKLSAILGYMYNMDLELLEIIDLKLR